MDIQKAIKYLRGLKNAFAEENEGPMTQKALDLAIRVLERAEWTDVCDALPTEQDEYIVEKDGYVFSAEYYPLRKVWVGQYTDNIDGIQRWRRLPDPWEETEG